LLYGTKSFSILVSFIQQSSFFFEFRVYLHRPVDIREHVGKVFSEQELVLSVEPEESFVLGSPGLARVLGARSFHQIADEMIERVLNIRRGRPSSTDDHGFQKSVPLIKILDVFDLNFSISSAQAQINTVKSLKIFNHNNL